MKNINSYFTLFIVALSVVIGFIIHPYGFNNASLNKGIAIGLSESCQAGYEVKGTQGFFSYCDNPFTFEYFEDSSIRLTVLDLTFTIGNPFQ